MNKSIPQNLTEAQTGESLKLDPAPYAVETFADLERGKQFITLHFRRVDTTRALAVSLAPEVLDALGRAGIILTGLLEINLSGPQGMRATPKSQWDCYLKAKVQVPVDAAGQAAVEALRVRYGKQ